MLAPLILAVSCTVASGFSVVAGGTGVLGHRLLDTLLANGGAATCLARNAYLARTPKRISHDWGHLPKRLHDARGLKVRDYCGGCPLDIVGQDWIGWQDDALPGATAVYNVAGPMSQDRLLLAQRMAEGLKRHPPKVFVSVEPTQAAMEGGAMTSFVGRCLDMFDSCAAEYSAIPATTRRIRVKLPQLVGNAAAGQPTVPVNKVQGDWIHVADAAACLARCAADESISGEVSITAAGGIVDAKGNTVFRELEFGEWGSWA